MNCFDNYRETMARALLGIVAAFALFTVISVAKCVEASPISPDDYFDWLRIEKSDKLHAQIRDAIRKLLDLGWIKESWDNEFMIEQLQKARQSEDFSRDEQEIIHKIYMVTNGLECEKGQVSVIQSLWVQVQSGEIPRGLQPLVERIGSLFSMSCSGVYSSHKKGWTIDLDLAKQLDRVFAAALNGNLAGPSTSVERVRLTRNLRKFDLTKDAFDGRKMVTVMSELSEGENAYQEEPFVLLKNFMISRCEQFDDQLKEVITIIDLSRKFQTGAYWANDLLERMDEYNRLCLVLSSPEKQEQIQSNLKKQLTKRKQRLASLQRGPIGYVAL